MVLLLAAAIPALPQTAEELRQALATAQGAERVDLLNRLSLAVRRVAPEEALQCGLEALLLSRQLGDRRAELEADKNIGVGHEYLSQYGQSLEAYGRGLVIARALGDPREVGVFLGNIGNVHRRLANFDQAVQYYRQALESAESIGDRRSVAYTLNNLGIVAKNLGDLDNALKYYRESLAIKKEIGEELSASNNLSNIGNVLRLQGKGAEALQHHLESLAVKEKHGDRLGQGSVLGEIGEDHRALGDERSALECFERSLAIRQEVGDEQGVADAWTSVGDIYAGLGMLGKAREYLEKALALAQRIGAKSEVAGAAGSLSQVCERLGDFRQALRYHRLYKETSDAMLSEESQRRIVQMRASQELGKKERENELLRRENELQSLNLAQQRRLARLYATLAILVAVVALLLVLNIARHLRSRRVLARIATTDELTAIANRRQILALAEEEVARARRYGHLLSAAVLDLDHFKRVNDSHGHAAGDQVLKAVAAACRSSIRRNDLVGRTGGDEFLFVLPHTGLEGALTVLERVRRSIRELRLEVLAGEPGPTASIGLAPLETSDLDLANLVRRADAAMYLAKQRGRDQVAVAEG